MVSFFVYCLEKQRRFATQLLLQLHRCSAFGRLLHKLINNMRRVLICLFAITNLLQFSCKSSSDNLTPEKIVGDYINGLNESNFKQIESCISDSLLTMESGFVLSENSKDYYIHYQWDSVFSPKYEIINSNKISDNSVEVTLSKTCNRIKYLHDTATIYKSKI